MAKKDITKVKNYTVVQANDLIRNKKDFSLWELRVFAMLASHVKKEDDDFQTYKFRIKDLLDLFETKSHNLYEELKSIPDKLHAKLIKIPYEDDKGKKRMRSYNLISMSDVPNEKNVDEGEYIMLRFDKDLKPLMLSLGKHFTVYKFYNILKLRSPYIFQLYELLKSEEYRGIHSIEISLEEFIEILQIPSSYKFGNIKQRILDPARSQFEEHTDIIFDYSPVKGRGGKIMSLSFRIYKNKKTASSLSLEEESKTQYKEIATENVEILNENSEIFNELYPKVNQWIGENAFRKLLEENSDIQVSKAVNYTLNRLKKGDTINNIAGHIVSMAKQKTLFDITENKKESAKKVRTKKKETNNRKQELENRKKLLSLELLKKQDTIMEGIFLEIPGSRETAFNAAKHHKFSYYKSELSDEDNMKSTMFKAAFRSAVKKEYGERFEALDKIYAVKIKSVSAALNLL